MAKILCIEDETPLRRIITAELRDAGHTTFEAGNGREGIAAAIEHRPDLIVCDINMPVMGGYEALAEIRGFDGDLGEVPFVFLSALTDRKDLITGRQLGADDYLTKPVDLDLLLATVAGRLARLERMGRKHEAERRRIDDERQAAEDRLHHLATHDEVTGLANRMHLLALTGQAIIASAGGPGPVVMLIEIDRFKSVAATLGRDFAEDLLKSAARRLGSMTGEGGIAARIGDDGFAALLPIGTGITGGQEIAESVRRSMAEPYDIGGRKIFTTVTVGLAAGFGPATTGTDLISRAETAVQDAKRMGGNIWRTYSEDIAHRELLRLNIEDALRTALEDHELELAFQPKVAMDTGRPVGMEALLRWNSSSMGWVSPATFIPVAEETGLILAIGNYVLRDACARMKAWLDAGFPADMQVAVNVSVKQFQQPDLVGTVRRALEDTGLPARSLVLEITESSLVEDGSDLVGTLTALRDLGITLSIDDFGTGYSSLSYLERLPAHELKIDQSFVRGLPHTSGSRTIVEAVIAIARSLNLKLVAEGVETEDQLAFLRERGCHVAQGYLFAKPLAPADFEAFVRSRMRNA